MFTGDSTGLGGAFRESGSRGHGGTKKSAALAGSRTFKSLTAVSGGSHQLSSAGTGGRIHAPRMTRRTILFSGNNDQSQNHVNTQDDVESEHTSHGKPPVYLSCFVIIPAEPPKRNKKLVFSIILDKFTNVFEEMVEFLVECDKKSGDVGCCFFQTTQSVV